MKNRILLLSVICIISLIGCKKQGSNNSITCINEVNINETDSLSSITTDALNL
jgi:hypothetical protein